jgi:anaerobic selenocysteine-containing dehydrogenase
MMNQELIVAQEIFMTPTAMLADYVLPGDVFSERNHVSDMWNWKLGLTLSQKAVEAPAEACSTFQFWRDLGHRMGYAEQFPWETVEQMLDYRLSPMGKTFEQFSQENYMYIQPPEYRKYRKTGFATPSGKVELKSSILEQLGFDPLPYYREGPAVSEEYPYHVFTGVREDAFFQTGQRQVKVLRDRSPSPKLFMHPVDAARQDIVDHDWVKLQTATGEVTAKVRVQESMKEGHIRVPHGWWYPEMRGAAKLAGAFISSDAVLCPDDPEFLDYEQGIPHFKGFPGRIVKLDQPPAGMSEQVLNG